MLPKHQRREQHGHHGIDVAENRRRLGLQLHQRTEVQGVGDAGVHNAHHQQKADRAGGERQRAQLLRQQHVGQKHRRRAAQLHDGAVVGGHVAQLLVHQNHAGVEHRRAQAQQHALQVGAAAARLQHAGDEHHAQQRCQHADQLLGRQALAHHQRRRENHEHRREVVAQRGRGDAGVVVGLEQQDPVHADGCAGQAQQTQLPAHRRPVHAALSQNHHQQQKQHAGQAAGHGHQAGRQRNIAPEDADGAEDHHGQRELEGCVHIESPPLVFWIS